MLHQKYEEELKKYEALINRKNEVDPDFYNGIYDRYVNPVLTREHIPLTWQYDLNPETNPYFMKRLGINAVMNSGAIELNGKYYLVARIEGDDRKSFFGVAESDNGIDGFRFWDYPILLPDTCKEETNVYDMRLTKHEDGYIYGCESHIIDVGSRNNILRHGDRLIPETEVVNTIRTLCYGKETLAVSTLNTNNEEILTIPLDGTRIERSIHHDALHEIRITLLVEVVTPL